MTAQPEAQLSYGITITCPTTNTIDDNSHLLDTIYEWVEKNHPTLTLETCDEYATPQQAILTTLNLTYLNPNQLPNIPTELKTQLIETAKEIQNQHPELTTNNPEYTTYIINI